MQISSSFCPFMTMNMCSFWSQNVVIFWRLTDKRLIRIALESSVDEHTHTHTCSFTHSLTHKQPKRSQVMNKYDREREETGSRFGNQTPCIFLFFFSEGWIVPHPHPEQKIERYSFLFFIFLLKIWIILLTLRYMYSVFSTIYFRHPEIR